MQRGLLLLNLGTPENTSISSVRSFLRAMLTDRRLIDLPAIIRYILVYVFILPFRSKRSAHAYQKIWTEQGSPLLYHSQNIIAQVQKKLGSDYIVALGMRYSQPSIASALDTLRHCASIDVLPLYPQYSSAATGSSIEQVMRHMSSWDIIPSVRIIRDFFQHPSYIKAQSELIKKYLHDYEYVLFSYHGIPERQLSKNQCKPVCIKDCPVLTKKNQACYKAQCHQSSHLLAQELGIPKNKYSTTFQSRLGKTKWIEPYTDKVLNKLASEGIKKLVIVCPSFVADCLETLEEIGMAAQQQWLDLGGTQLIVVPCLNDNPLWIEAIAEIIL